MLLSFFRRRKVEQVFSELFLLLDRTQDQLSTPIFLSTEQMQLFAKSETLSHFIELKKDAYHNFYITSFSILNAMCKLLSSKNIELIVTPEEDKIVQVKLLK